LEAAHAETARQTQQVHVLTQRLSEAKALVEAYRSRSNASTESEVKRLQLTVAEYDREVQRLQKELENRQPVSESQGRRIREYEQ